MARCCARTTRGYVRRLEAGQLTTKEMHRIGLPWSPELMVRTRYTVGGRWLRAGRR